MFQQLRRIWEKMGPPQRTLLAAVAALAALGCVGAAIWGSRPAFRLLKSGLDRETAAKALARLDEGGVRYRLENDGRDVLVDARDFDRAQSTLVQNRILSADEGGGYRAIDGVSFGLTEEQQKLRMRIALEEEISRSLRQFDGVEGAKVHLAPAEKSFTRRDSAPAKASVILRLRAGKALDDAQTEAMCRLVANASPGLLAENVTLTDTSGMLLSKGAGSGSAASLAAGLAQTRMREQYLAEKAQSALDRALGPDRAIVRVDVVVETDRVDSTKIAIRPETKVVLQEKLSSSEDASKRVGGPVGADAKVAGIAEQKAGGSSTEEVATTFDYERETIRTTREPGAVKRLTVGVLADAALESRKSEIERVVKGAVGYDADRGDQFLDVAFVPFAERPAAEDPAAGAAPATGFAIPPVMELVKWGTTGVVALVLGFLILRSIRTARASMSVALAEAAREAKPDIRRVDPAEHISSEIERDAQAVGRLLRNWLYETSARN